VELPYGRQTIDDEDIAAVVTTLKSDWLTQGPEIVNFERDLAKVVGAKHAISCSSGTAALHLALFAARIGPGTSVIVPANTFVATANAVRHVGAEISFADIDPTTGLMTAEHAVEALRQRSDREISGIMPVHYAGQCEKPPSLRSMAEKEGITVIEDACHALGTSYKVDENVLMIGGCQHSSMAAFSFHPVKTIAMGEGGAVTTNEDVLAERLRELRNHGLTRNPQRFMQKELAFGPDGSPNPWYYELSEPGLNYRASGLHCALGRSQLKKLGHFIRERRRLVVYYNGLIKHLSPLVQPLRAIDYCIPAWHLYPVRIDFAQLGIERKSLIDALSTNGIRSQVHYIPVPWQPYYKDRYGPINLPGTEAYYRRCLSLPLFVGMGKKNVERVVNTLCQISGLPKP
tara:strand:- start:3892 stop:5097 length:1206 start_codon:yes stop_codon:yes gene_type:complete